MSTTFRCTSSEGCEEELELPMHYIPARNEAHRRGWKSRGSADGLDFFCPDHTPPPSRRY